MSLSVTRDDPTNTTKEDDAADDSDEEVIARSPEETRTEPCSEGIDIQNHEAYGMKLEDSKGFESMRDADIDVQSNDAYGLEVEDSGYRKYENVLEFI